MRLPRGEGHRCARRGQREGGDFPQSDLRCERENGVMARLRPWSRRVATARVDGRIRHDGDGAGR